MIWDLAIARKNYRKKIAIIDDKFRAQLVGRGISLEEAKILLEEDELRMTLEAYAEDFHLTEEELKKPLLEVGAARGDFIKHIRETFGNTHAWGVDVYESKASKYTEGMVVANGILLPFEDDTFDIVIAKDYMPMFYTHSRKGGGDSTTPLKEMLRVASKGGKIMFNTSTPERELEKEHEEHIDDPEFIEKSKKYHQERYNNAVLFFNYLSQLEKEGYKITTEEHDGRTIVTIINP